jgi:hypothetical protein
MSNLINIPGIGIGTKENLEKCWRNQELKNTDWIIPIEDHPQRSAYITYRQELRDWPSTDNFPNTRPTI